MNNSTFVFSKDSLTDTEVEFDISPLLKFGETLVSVVPQAVSPVSTPALSATLTSDVDSPVVRLLLAAGDAGISYGMQVLITTDARQVAALVAVSVTADVQVPYTTQNPEAYADLVDTIEAGQAAIGTAVFSFPPELDPSGGFVTWEFLDAEGTVYANGNAFDYQIQSNGLTNTVRAQAVINVPSSVPPSAFNSKYQLRYTLELPSDALAQVDPALAPNQNRFYSYENLTVTGLATVPTGTQDSMEIRGNKATVSIVVDKMYDKVTVQLCADNKVIGQAAIQDFSRVSSGYYFGATFDTASLPESLVPYTVVWNYGFASNPNQEMFSESAALWVVNSSMMQAVSDVKAKINKARATLYGQSDDMFSPTTIMTWLRRAADSFNGSPGGFTAFTFINAKGSIREYWLMYAELLALESRYLSEAEKTFNFSGAAISLDVDLTGFMDTAASKIQSRLDNEIKAFKQLLIMRGATRGDGSVDPSRLQQGALGSVGINISPATPWGPYRSGILGNIIR